jgi:hypothetical protein
VAQRFEFVETQVGSGWVRRLRLAKGSHELRGPEKYRILELRRRRAQIRARRALGIV